MQYQKRRSGFRRARPGRWLRLLALACLVVLLLFLLYSCAVQRMVYSSRGTMIFLPASPLG